VKAVANPEFRARLPENLIFLIRAIAPFKNSGRDWTYSDVANEALVEWLQKPENLALITDQRLIEALERRGLKAPEQVSKALKKRKKKPDSGTPESGESQ
jgi:hypothetical protein